MSEKEATARIARPHGEEDPDHPCPRLGGRARVERSGGGVIMAGWNKTARLRMTTIGEPSLPLAERPCPQPLPPAAFTLTEPGTLPGPLRVPANTAPRVLAVLF